MLTVPPQILNFSIAYGKTAHGLSKDWGVDLDEAKATVDAWYNDRPEVKRWQEAQHKQAQAHGWVSTILGRQRQLPDAMGAGMKKAHALRAAINTPIQGGAADIAMLAMLRLDSSTVLKGLRWRLLMQVHDEVILEGPEQSCEEALAEVVRSMENPFGGEKDVLKCKLSVSASYAKTWYEAK
jgi:DNA polymerase-1